MLFLVYLLTPYAGLVMLITCYRRVYRQHLCKALSNHRLFPGLILRHLAGVIILMTTSVIYAGYTFEPSFFQPIPGSPAILLLLTIFIFAAGLTAFNASRKKIRSLNTYHHLPPMAVVYPYLALRILFLFWYEVYFRGILLFSSTEILPVFPAVALNLLLYFIIHLPDGKKQAIGSIPFGLVLCAFCLVSQSVWPAIILHLALSLSYELPLMLPKPFKSWKT